LFTFETEIKTRIRANKTLQEKLTLQEMQVVHLKFNKRKSINYNIIISCQL